MAAIEVTAIQRVRARELTPTLRAVKAGEVWQEANGSSVETCAEYFGLSDPIADVTEEVALLASATLAVVRPLESGSGGRWELTAAGDATLAELDGA